MEVVCRDKLGGPHIGARMDLEALRGFVIDESTDHGMALRLCMPLMGILGSANEPSGLMSGISGVEYGVCAYCIMYGAGTGRRRSCTV